MKNQLPLFPRAGADSEVESEIPKRRARIRITNAPMAPPLTNPTKNNGHLLSKETGSYYTSDKVAKFLVSWAIRSSQDTVLDPSFGGGVFLRAASERLKTLKGNPDRQVFGIELDTEVHVRTSSELKRDLRIPIENLLAKDFFDVEPLPVRQVNAVIGNPPFIRYQRFTDEVRKQALARAADEGVKLTKLSSSWAPFVVHSISMIKEGGRLAMVLPGELGYAKYALPVLDYLTRSFGKIILLTFKKKLFPGLSEDTLLLLAQDKGKNTSRVLHRDLEGDGSLKDVKVSKNYSLGGVRGVPTSPILTKRQRLIEYLLPKKTRELYNEVKEAEHVYRLGDLADVGIGYVTGANDFFHLSPDQIKYFKIPKRFLKNAVKRSRAFRGLEFTQSDWDSALVRGESGYLLSINPQAELSTELSEYLRMGEEKGVSNAYKCRVRKPWYSVPHVFEPDGFLSYMSTGFPNLVTNGAGAVAPNTLHVLRLREPARISSSDIATSWPTSLTRLSVEIEGHSLGGGMLKLEPTEAENCLVAFTGDRRGDLQELALEMDRLLRLGNDRKATERADKMLLRKSLNLSVSDCRLLMDGAELLRNRRAKRSERG